MTVKRILDNQEEQMFTCMTEQVSTLCLTDALTFGLQPLTLGHILLHILFPVCPGYSPGS